MSTLCELQASVTRFMHGARQIVRDLPSMDQSPEEIKRCKEVLLSEVKELFVGMETGDLVEIVDGLGDVIYVALSIANTYGIQMQSIMEAICQNNLAKIVEPVQFWPNGKLKKPEDHVAPDIAGLILDQVEGGTEDQFRAAMEKNIDPTRRVTFE